MDKIAISKLNTYSDGFKVLLTLGKLFRDYKPLAFFSVIAFVLFLFASGFFIPVLWEYLQYGTVSGFPTLIVCGFAVHAALLSLFTGLILQVMHRCNRRNIEILFHEIENRKNQK